MIVQQFTGAPAANRSGPTVFPATQRPCFCNRKSPRQMDSTCRPTHSGGCVDGVGGWRGTHGQPLRHSIAPNTNSKQKPRNHAMPATKDCKIKKEERMQRGSQEVAAVWVAVGAQGGCRRFILNLRQLTRTPAARRNPLSPCTALLAFHHEGLLTRCDVRMASPPPSVMRFFHLPPPPTHTNPEPLFV